MHIFFAHPGTISRDSENKQVLDKLQVERERGITVKAQTASLFYNHEGEIYLLNLIDTPVSVNQLMMLHVFLVHKITFRKWLVPV